MTSNSSTLSALPHGCADFDKMADELFSEKSENFSSAINRIAEWEKRGDMAVEIEISAVLVNIFQRESEFIDGVAENEALSQDLLRTLMVMTIQRLVTAVQQCPRSTNLSTTDPTEATDLPRLLVDIHDGWSRGKLPDLSVLRVASAQALFWLKTNYWEQQKDALKQAIDTLTLNLEYPEENPTNASFRATLKAELDDHCNIMAEIFSPSSRIYCFEHRNDPNMSVKMEKWNKAQYEVFKVILDMSWSSPEDLVSIMVDDGLLTVDPYSLEGSSKLQSSRDNAWKFTIKELSKYLPRLPAMLLKSIMRHIKSRFSYGEGSETGTQIATTSQSGANMIEQRRNLKRLTCWFHWLLGKRASRAGAKYPKAKSRCLKLRDDDLRQLELLNIPVAKSVTIDLREEFSGELLQVCLQTSVLGIPLLEYEPGIAVKLQGGNLQKVEKRKLVDKELCEDASQLGTTTTSHDRNNSLTPARLPGEPEKSTIKTELQKRRRRVRSR